MEKGKIYILIILVVIAFAVLLTGGLSLAQKNDPAKTVFQAVK